MAVQCTESQKVAHLNKKEKPNIIVIFSDEAAPTHMSCYGGQLSTPHIDSIGKKGVRFNRAYASSPACTPSRYSLLTGKYANRCQHTEFKAQRSADEPCMINWSVDITPGEPTIFSYLKDRGYYTGITGKWHVGNNIDLKIAPHPEVGKEADLDDPVVDKALKDHQEAVCDAMKKTYGMDYASSIYLANTHELKVDALDHHNIEWVTEGALDFIDHAHHSEKPFFLYATCTAVHGPDHATDLQVDPMYTPGGKRTKPYTGHPSRASIAQRLEQEGLAINHTNVGLKFLDDHVGAILKKVKSLGIEKNTIIIYAADHNVEPGKATCYQHGVHIPMLMQWPDHIKPNTVSHALVQQTDILPTVVEATGKPVDASVEMDGVSFLNVSKGLSKSSRQQVYCEMGITRAIINDRYSYIAFRYPEDKLKEMVSGTTDMAYDYMLRKNQAHNSIAMRYYPSFFEQDQLFDLLKDPQEQNNIATNKSQSLVLKEMQKTLVSYVKTFPNPYNMQKQPFLETPQFKKMAQKRKEVKPPSWWNAASFHWPEPIKNGLVRT